MDKRTVGIVGCGNISGICVMHAVHEASDTGRHLEPESTCSRPDPLPERFAAGRVR